MFDYAYFYLVKEPEMKDRSEKYLRQFDSGNLSESVKARILFMASLAIDQLYFCQQWLSTYEGDL